MKGKLGLILLIFTFSSTTFFAQTNNWIWARSSVGTTGSQSLGVSINADNYGNVFITGQFHDPTIAFGSFTLTNSDQSQVTTDLFVAKYDSIGNVLWAKRAGGNSFDDGWGVTTDLNGNLLVVGSFASSSIAFGSNILTNSSAIYDMFIVKYATNGNVLWAKSAGGASGFDVANSVTTDSAGNIYVAGYFGSAQITFGSFTLNNSGGQDAFVVKYDPSGNVIWAKSVGGANHDEFSSISTDGHANVFVTGQFQSPTINFATNVLTNNGNRDFMIAKYDSSGNVLWAKGAVGSQDEVGNSISADIGGSAYVTGYFRSPTITFGNIMLNNSGNQDAFIVKYDELGNVLWARSAIGTFNDEGYSATNDLFGNVYISGGFEFNDTITFGSTTLVPPAGSTAPMFIIKYDLNGNVLCASALSGGGDSPNGVSADPYGNAYVVGDFWSNPFIVGFDTLLFSSHFNVFVAKYDCSNNVGINEFIQPNNISFYPNPSEGIFTVDHKFTNGEISIYNSLGKIILQSQINESTSQIDLSEQPSGLYFVQIISDSKYYSEKLIKQ